MTVKINNTPSQEAIENFAKQLEGICKNQKNIHAKKDIKE